MAGPHHAADRAPPLHPGAGRPDRGAGPRPGRRRRHRTRSSTERCPLYRLLLSGPGDDAEGIDAGDLTRAAAAASTARTDPRRHRTVERPRQRHGIAVAATRRSRPLAPKPSRRHHPEPVAGPRTTPTLWPVPTAPPRACQAWRRRRRRAPAPHPAEAAASAASGSMPPTPELLAKVAALPPATDVPKVAQAEARAADPAFSPAQAPASLPPGAAARPAAGRRGHRGRAGAAGADPAAAWTRASWPTRCRRSSACRWPRWR